MSSDTAQAMRRALKRPLFAAGTAFLAAAWIGRIALNSSLVLLIGGSAALLLIVADIARTRRHGY